MYIITIQDRFGIERLNETVANIEFAMAIAFEFCVENKLYASSAGDETYPNHYWLSMPDARSPRGEKILFGLCKIVPNEPIEE